MISADQLYKKTKLPMNDELIHQILQCYLDISRTEMMGFSDINTLIYQKINLIDTKETHAFNEKKRRDFCEKVNRDYMESGNIKRNKYGAIIDPTERMPGWKIFRSWDLLGTKDLPPNAIAHRFYIAAKPEVVHELCSEFYDKFKEAKIPFYFKYDESEKRTRRDKVVVYTSNEFFQQTYDIVTKLMNERSDLANECYDPSIIMGKLGNKIGYAMKDTSSSSSYTSTICQSFADALSPSIQDFLKRNPHISVIENNHEILAKDYYKKDMIYSEEKVKTRILVNMFLKIYPSYKSLLYNKIRSELTKNGINLDSICFNEKVKQELEEVYKKEKANKAKGIRLPNGKTMTKQEYLEKNNVEYWVPLTAKVTLRNGTVMTGEEFIKEALKVAKNFNTFQELMFTYADRVDRTANIPNKKVAESTPSISPKQSTNKKKQDQMNDAKKILEQQYKDAENQAINMANEQQMRDLKRMMEDDFFGKKEREKKQRQETSLKENSFKENHLNGIKR